MNTEVLFAGSHRNSTVFSWVGLALGSVIPTDIGISEKYNWKSLNSSEGSLFLFLGWGEGVSRCIAWAPAIPLPQLLEQLNYEHVPPWPWLRRSSVRRQLNVMGEVYTLDLRAKW